MSLCRFFWLASDLVFIALGFFGLEVFSIGFTLVLTEKESVEVLGRLWLCVYPANSHKPLLQCFVFREVDSDCAGQDYWKHTRF